MKLSEIYAQVSVAGGRYQPPRGSYDGAEMRPYEGRPGANDALALPSRMGNWLVYRDGRRVRAPESQS